GRLGQRLGLAGQGRSALRPSGAVGGGTARTGSDDHGLETARLVPAGHLKGGIRQSRERWAQPVGRRSGDRSLGADQRRRNPDSLLRAGGGWPPPRDRYSDPRDEILGRGT